MERFPEMFNAEFWKRRQAGELSSEEIERYNKLKKTRNRT